CKDKVGQSAHIVIAPMLKCKACGTCVLKKQKLVGSASCTSCKARSTFDSNVPPRINFFCAAHLDEGKAQHDAFGEIQSIRTASEFDSDGESDECGEEEEGEPPSARKRAREREDSNANEAVLRHANAM